MSIRETRAFSENFVKHRVSHKVNIDMHLEKLKYLLGLDARVQNKS